MKKALLTCIFSVVLHCTFAQSWTYSNRISGSEDLVTISSTTDLDDNIILFGHFSGTVETEGITLTTYGGRDYFLVKVNPLGEIEWLRQLGSTGSDYVGGGICACVDGNIYLTGGYRDDFKYTPTDSIASTGAFDIFLAKFDGNGNALWCRNAGAGSGNQRATTLKVDGNNVLISGFYNDSVQIYTDTTLYSDNSIQDFFYGSFSTETGDLNWAKAIKGISDPVSGRIFKIARVNDHYLFSGTYKDSIAFDNDTLVSINTSNCIHVFATDTVGNLDWFRTIGGDGVDLCYTLVSDDIGNAYVGAYSDSPTINVQSNETDFDSFTNNGGSDLVVVNITYQVICSGQIALVGAPQKRFT